MARINENLLLVIHVYSLYAVEWEELFLENQATKFRVHTKMSSRIGVLRIFPGITAEAVSNKAANVRCN